MIEAKMLARHGSARMILCPIEVPAHEIASLVAQTPDGQDLGRLHFDPPMVSRAEGGIYFPPRTIMVRVAAV
ncbi:MAG: hypothetical protein ACK4TG_11025 [Thermaurantiacus sp.]